MKIHFIIIIIYIQFAISQLIPNIDNHTQFKPLNSNKIIHQQKFSIGTSSNNNQTVSYGMFTNNFVYNIKPDLLVSGGIHLLQQSGQKPNQTQFQNIELLYDMNLKYQPWENAWIELSISNLSPFKITRNIFQP